jgi:hypothetical protein
MSVVNEKSIEKGDGENKDEIISISEFERLEPVPVSRKIESVFSSAE